MENGLIKSENEIIEDNKDLLDDYDKNLIEDMDTDDYVKKCMSDAVDFYRQKLFDEIDYFLSYSVDGSMFKNYIDGNQIIEFIRQLKDKKL